MLTEINKEISLLEKKIKDALEEIEYKTSDLDDLRTDIDDFDSEDELQVEIEKRKTLYYNEITNEYIDRIEDLTTKIDDAKTRLESHSIDSEDPEMIELHERKQYLDSIAIFIVDFGNSIIKNSSRYFLDFGYTKKKYNLGSFKNKLENAKKITEVLSERDIFLTPQQKIYKSLSSIDVVKDNPSISIPITGVFTSIIGIFYFAVIVKRGIVRSRKIHEYSRMYFRLVNSLSAYRDATLEELKELTDKILVLQKDIIQKELDKLLEEQKTLDDEISSKKELFSVDEGDLEITIEEALNKLKEEFDLIERTILELQKEIDKYTSDKEDKEEQRKQLIDLYTNKYMNIANKDRTNTLPQNILLDYTESTINIIPFKTGLYVYKNYEDVENLVILHLYQMRNYVKAKTYQAHVFDTRMALFLDFLSFATPKDIYTDFSVFHEKDSKDGEFKINSRVDLIYESILRRRNALKGYSSIKEYNEIFTESPAPQDIIYIMVNKSGDLTERLINIIDTGKIIGIDTYIFISAEDMTPENSKFFRRYVKSVYTVNSDNINEISYNAYEEKPINIKPLKR